MVIISNLILKQGQQKHAYSSATQVQTTLVQIHEIIFTITTKCTNMVQNA